MIVGRTASASVSTSHPPPSVSKRPKESKSLLRKRRLIVNEILATEETYVTSLQLLLTDILVPIEERFRSKLNKSTRMTLITSTASLETLIVLHQRLLEDLKARASSIVVAVKHEQKKAGKETRRRYGGRQLKPSSGSRTESKSPVRKSSYDRKDKRGLASPQSRTSIPPSPGRKPPKSLTIKKSKSDISSSYSRPKPPPKSPKGASTPTKKGGLKTPNKRSKKAAGTPSPLKTKVKNKIPSPLVSPRGHLNSNPLSRENSSRDSYRNSESVVIPEFGEGDTSEVVEEEAPDAHEILAQQEAEGAVIGLFDEYSPHFKMYFSYVQNYPKLSMDLGGSVSSKSLARFIEKACKKAGQHSILSLLILPIQRIPRYLLLLQSLDKNTPGLHLHLPRLVRTITDLQKVTKAINECQRQSDNSLKLFQLQNTLQKTPPDLQILTPSREFVKQEVLFFLQAEELGGEIDETKWSEALKVNMMLFNDMLILVVAGKNEYKRHFMLHDITIKEGKRRASWDLYTGSPELLFGRLNFNNKAHLKAWGTTAFPVIQQAKELHVQQERKSKSHSKQSHESVIDRVNVYMRVRPFVTQRETEMKEKCLTLENDTTAVLHRPGTGGGGPSERVRERVAVFDHCFPETSTQTDVFRRVGEEVLGSVFCGYNCAIIAYGNTGSGKTYTITGGEGNARGLLPRVLEKLFDILDRSMWKNSKIQVSYVQIYCNKLYDLQGSEKHTSKTLKIVARGGQHEVSGVVKTDIKSVEEAMKIIELGNKKRHTRAHKMNDASSRSHSVFTIHCQLHNSTKNSTTKTTLQLVDLAGSENIKETGVEGVALTESMHINRSLTSLGRALHAVLSNEGKSSGKKQVVSFRETTLTHMLSDVLSGNFVCSLILTASSSPAYRQAELTSKTMAFGMGAKRLDVRVNPNKEQKESKLSHFLTGVWRTVNWG